MPQAIHERIAFNSRNREVAIHCVFSVKDNTLMAISAKNFSEKGRKNSRHFVRGKLLEVLIILGIADYPFATDIVISR